MTWVGRVATNAQTDRTVDTHDERKSSASNRPGETTEPFQFGVIRRTTAATLWADIASMHPNPATTMSVYPQAKGIENREAWRDRASLPTRIFKRGHAAGNGVAVDVSRGGLSLETTTALAPGTICQLCVEVEPGHEFSVYARVTRSENDRVGFAFDPGDPRTIDALFDAWTLSSRGPFVEEEAWPTDDEANAA